MSIHYKFKSAKDFSTITFDTPFVSLGELKQRIIQQQKLGRGPDFDLEVVNAQTKEVYTDNNKLVPKNSSVIVSRVPANKAATSIQPQTLPKEPASIQTSLPVPPVAPPVSSIKTVTELATVTSETDESEAISKLVESATWDTKPSPLGGVNIHGHHGGRTRHNFGSTLPPGNYICHRCGKPGHYIQFCPTNNDPNFNTPRVKKPTGIPRSFLVPVSESEAGQTGIMMLPGGGFAKMAPNEYVSTLLLVQER